MIWTRFCFELCEIDGAKPKTRFSNGADLAYQLRIILDDTIGRHAVEGRPYEIYHALHSRLRATLLETTRSCRQQPSSG